MSSPAYWPKARANESANIRAFQSRAGRYWAALKFIVGKAASLTRLVPLAEIPQETVEALLDTAFGADRKSRTAYRLRQGVSVIDALSFAAVDDAARCVGSIQCWPVALLDAEGGKTPLVLVGPVAVSPEAQRGGIGKLLMTASLTAAEQTGYDALMMIGDPEYYDRFFGFSAAPTQGWDLPGPFERHRLLAKIRRPGGVPAAGLVVPDPDFARLATTA